MRELEHQRLQNELTAAQERLMQLSTTESYYQSSSRPTSMFSTTQEDNTDGGSGAVIDDPARGEILVWTTIVGFLYNCV